MRPQDVVSVGVLIAAIGLSLDGGVRLLRHPAWGGERPSADAATPEQELYRHVAIDYRASRKTFLLLVDSGCPYSTRSMPFYRRLVDAAGRQPAGQVRVVGVATEPRRVIAPFFETHGVRPDVLISLDPNVLTVQRTPTLLLMDSEGRMEHSWVGGLSKDEEDAVVALATAAPGHR